jgi:hypothetical protein
MQNKYWSNYFSILLIQLILLTPLYWFIEQIQHILIYFLINDWVWIYPNSYHPLYSVWSSLLWALFIILAWSVYYFIFIPYKFKYITRILIGGFLGYLSENTISLSTYFLTGKYFLEDFMTFSAQISFFLLWILSLIIYEFVTTKLINMRPGLVT